MHQIAAENREAPYAETAICWDRHVPGPPYDYAMTYAGAAVCRGLHMPGMPGLPCAKVALSRGFPLPAHHQASPCKSCEHYAEEVDGAGAGAAGGW